MSDKTNRPIPLTEKEFSELSYEKQMRYIAAQHGFSYEPTGKFQQQFLPNIVHGPVYVVVNNQHKLLEINHIADLIEALSPTERVLFQFDLQSVINDWCERKGIPHT